MLLGDGRMNFKILFLKIKKLSEFLILLSRLFQSITVDEKHEFLEKVCLTLLRNDVNISCSVCTPNRGDIIELITGGWFLISLEKYQSFLYHRRCCKIPNLILDNVFPLRNLL